MPTTGPQKKPQKAKAKAKGSHKPTEMAAMAVQRHNLQPIKLAVRVPWKMVVHT